jgi:hypothetical protein
VTDIESLLPWTIIGVGVYAFWYWWYWCMKGKQPMPCIAIYPSPPECEIAPNLPFYLPRPPFLGPPEQCLTSNCKSPPMCLAFPQCQPGTVNNPMGCNCIAECDIVAYQNGNPTGINPCPCGTRFNWCTKSCIPSGSLIPDCPPPQCAA